jgi:alpha-tubulin suppressor-like RCC1 family protein
MSLRRLLGVAAVVLGACVGDDSTTVDGGNDATVDQSSTNDGGSGDATDAGPVTLVQYGAGDSTSCATFSDGSIWCWGDNTYGQTGLAPTMNPQFPPQRVPGLPAMKLVSPGGFFTCALSQTSQVWCWGDNNVGQLGHPPNGGTPPDQACGTSLCNPTPQMIPGIAVTGVSSSTDFACAITAGTTTGVTCWGQYNAGQLETADSGAPFALTGMPTSNTISKIYAKAPGGTACIVDHFAHLWCWGDNSWGQAGHTPGTLGDVLTSPNHYAAVVPREVSYAPDGGGGFLSNVISAHASYATCAVIGDAGGVDSGALYCWGDNVAGVLGNGTADPSTGIIPHPQPTLVPGLANVTDVRGGNSMCALVANGDVYCWGSQVDLNSVPGTGTCTTYLNGAETTCTLTPTLVNGVSAYTMAVDHVHILAGTTDGGLVAWGNNADGELGHQPGSAGDMGTSPNYFNVVPTPVQGLP